MKLAQSNIHKKERGKWDVFSKPKNDAPAVNNVSKENTELEELGLVIHFTPNVIYLYICKEETIELNNGGIEMTDLEGRYIGISGSIVTLELSSMNDLPKIIDQYSLKDLNIPMIRIFVKY